MDQQAKTLLSILSGTCDANMKFTDIQILLNSMGFIERIRGDHHIYTKKGISEKINIQPNGSKAKLYQVKQIRNIIIKYKLGESINVQL